MTPTRRTPGSVCIHYYALRARLECVPSPTGEQIEHLRTQARMRVPDREAGLRELADIGLLMAGCSDMQKHLLFLRYGTSAGLEPYDALRSASEIEDADGEGEVLIPGIEGQIPDNPDLRRVAGVRSRFPSYAEIGKQVGMGEKAVKVAIGEALGLIAEAMRWRLFAQATIEREDT